jgi:hypothetical protein
MRMSESVQSQLALRRETISPAEVRQALSLAKRHLRVGWKPRSSA